MKEENLRIKMLMGIGIIVALGVGMFWAIAQYSNPMTPVDSQLKQDEIDDDGLLEVDPVVSDDAHAIPLPANYASLDRSRSPYTSAQDAKLTEEFNKRIVLIQETPTSVWAWIELGSIKYGYNDDRGAEQAWLHATQLAPTHTSSHANLAQLYWHRLKNYPKAEEQFRIVLQYDATYVPAYRDLSDMYRYDYTEKSALADDVLREGIAQLPAETDLVAHLALYYSEMKEWANAVKYLEQLAEARQDDEQIASDLAFARQQLAKQ